METPHLLMGAAEAPITPPVGLRLVGPLARSTGVHDDLWARSIVLSHGTTSVALVFLDLIGIDMPLSDGMRAEIRRRAGVSSVLINCSHTHSAPFTVSWSVEGRAEYEEEAASWQNGLISTVADLVALAAARQRPAIARYGRAPAQVGVNRRLSTPDGIDMQPNPHGPVVPWVDVLRFDTINGSNTAVIVSHSAHPVIVHGASTLMGADYPGVTVQAIRQHLGDKATVAFAQGCCGNINGEPLRGGFDAAQEAGLRLADAALAVCERGEPVEGTCVRSRQKTITLPLQDYPTMGDCRELLVRQERVLESAGDDVERWYAHENIRCTNRLIRAILRDAKSGGIQFELNALAFGNDVCLVTMTDEVFCDYQLWAVENSPARHTMVWAYTNGCEIYVPVDAALGEGGYEAASSPTLEYASALYYHNGLALKRGAEAAIKAAIGELLGELYTAE